MKRIGFILGKRIRGDIELGRDPTTQRRGEIIGPGFRIPGRPQQDIYVESVDQNYEAGSRMMLGDRVFRYSYAIETLTGLRGKFTDGNRLYNNLRTPPPAPTYAPNVLAEQFATEFTFTPECNGDDPAIGADDLAGGYLACFNPYITQQIKSNTERAAGVLAPITLTLERPLPHEIPVDTYVSAYPNPWRFVKDKGEEPPGVATPHNHIYNSVCCVPVRTNITAERWFWGLTWGPVIMVVNPGLGNMVGRRANMREIYFGNDGGLCLQGVVGPQLAEVCLQHGGFIIMNGHSDLHAIAPNVADRTPYGDQLVMIQIAP